MKKEMAKNREEGHYQKPKNKNKKTFTKKKRARPNPRLAAAALSPQLFHLFFLGLKPAIHSPSSAFSFFFLPSPPTEAITTISQTNPLSASPYQQLFFFLGHLPIAMENQHPKTQWFQPQAAAKQRQVFLSTQLQQQPLLFGPAFRATPIS